MKGELSHALMLRSYAARRQPTLDKCLSPAAKSYSGSVKDVTYACQSSARCKNIEYDMIIANHPGGTLYHRLSFSESDVAYPTEH